MKKTTTFLLTLIFGFSILNSTYSFSSNNTLPPCPPGNVILANQAEIDDWVALNNGCDIIDGNLMIGPNSIISDISDISGLSSIVEITGDLIMNKTALTDFTGLGNLQTIGGSLELNTVTITDFDGLENLQSVGGDFTVEYASSLLNVNGLINLNTIEGDLNFTGCGNLESLSALANFSNLGGSLNFHNTNLVDLNGLQSLITIGGDLSFGSNFGASLNGLQNLTTIGGDLYAAYTDFTDFAYLENLTSINSLTLNSCDQLTDLGALSGITSVQGGINISGCDALVDLDGLHNLTSIGESLVLLGNNLLVNIEAFENLTSVGGVIGISHHETLASLQGIHNISSAGGIYIAENDLMESINVFSNITTVESLRIENNPILANLIGLENITSITGSGNYQGNIIGNDALVDLTGLNGLVTNDAVLRVEDNLSLTSFIGLENLTTLNGELFVENNASLISFEGLNNLETLNSFGYIIENASLENFSGLENLTSITQNLWIDNNPSLTTLNGFGDDITIKSLNISFNAVLSNISGLENSTITNQLIISNNPQLSDCSINAVCSRILNGQFVSASGNLQGCNSQDEIKEGCNYGKIKGTLRYDTDVNCIQDPADYPLSNWKIIGIQDNFNQVTFTDNEGNYQFSAPPGEYSVIAIPPNNLWSNCIDPNTYIIEEDETIEVDLLSTVTTFCPLMEVDIEAPTIRNCFESAVYVKYCNNGTQTAQDVSIEIFLDDFLEIVSSPLTYTIDSDGDLHFEVGEVLPGECGNFYFNVFTSCDSDLGQTLCTSASIYPDTSCVNPIDWTGADIRIDENCTADEVNFTIENIGYGDMVVPELYRVFKDDVLIEEDSFFLLSGEVVSFSYPADGSSYGFYADPIPYHPFVTFPAEINEACTGAGTTYSTGYVLQFPLPDYGEPYDRYCGEVTGSFDPNDKRGFPIGYGDQHLIPKESEIDYMIRFQNTGTDTAFTVVIRDTLSSRFDYTTLKQGSSSHNYWLEVLDEEILVFTFDNILLPDSFVNEPASNGFVTFKISTKPNLFPNTVINNSAGIYFDFNEPVITNTTEHKIGFETTLDTIDVSVCEGKTYRGITYFDNATIFDTSIFNIFRKITRININVEDAASTVIDTMILFGNEIDGVPIFSDTTFTEFYATQSNCDSIVVTNVEIIVPPTIAISPPNYYAGINEIPLTDFSIDIQGDYLTVQYSDGNPYTVLSLGQGIEVDPNLLLGVPVDVGIELIYNIGGGESDTIFNVVPLNTGMHNETFLTSSTLWGITGVATPNLDTILLNNPLDQVGLGNFEWKPSTSVGLENVLFVVNGNEFSISSDVKADATSTLLSLENDYTGLIQNLDYQLGSIEILFGIFDVFEEGIYDFTIIPSIDLTTSLSSTSPSNLILEQKIVIENGSVNQTYETGIYTIEIGQNDNQDIELTNFLDLIDEQNLFFRRYLIIENQEVLVEEVFVDNMVSTDNIQKTKIELFPNPVEGGELIYLKIPEEYKNDNWRMKIYDVEGRVVASQILDKYNPRVISPESNGVYLIHLENDKNEILYSNFVVAK